jgi:hypothetical protein
VDNGPRAALDREVARDRAVQDERTPRRNVASPAIMP